MRLVSKPLFIVLYIPPLKEWAFRTEGGKIMTISEKIEFVRNTKNLTKTFFCETVGMSRSYYDSLIAEKNSEKIINKTTNVSIINSICYLFNINKQWLTDDNLNIDFFNKEIANQQIIDNYMLLSNECKDIVDNLIAGLLKIQSKDNNNDIPQTFAASSSQIKNSKDNDDSIPILVN